MFGHISLAYQLLITAWFVYLAYMTIRYSYRTWTDMGLEVLIIGLLCGAMILGSRWSAKLAEDDRHGRSVTAAGLGFLAVFVTAVILVALYGGAIVTTVAYFVLLALVAPLLALVNREVS